MNRMIQGKLKPLRSAKNNRNTHRDDGCFMKKTVLIMLVTAIMLFSSAFAEPSVHCSFNIIHSDFQTDITADLFTKQDQAFIQSSLFPDSMLRADPGISRLLSSGKPFRFLSPAAMQNAFLQAKQDILGWIKELPNEKSKGIYSGELFDTAASRISYVFMLDHLEMYLKEQIASRIKKEEPDREDLSCIFLLSVIASQIRQISDEAHIAAEAGLYDEDRFLSLNIKNGQNTVMTVSLDFSADQSMKALIIFKEKDQYRMIEYSILFSENRAEAIVRHFLSSSPYYRLIDNSDPVYSVTFKLAEETDNRISFTSDFASNQLSHSFMVNGDITDDMIIGYARFTNQDQPVAEISMQFSDSNPVQPAADDRTIVEIKDSESEKQFRQSIWSGVLPVIIQIIPYLPAEYSELLIDLTQ